ncbi:TPA: host cell division inhibitor Icd-like protein [Enterobacter cloacae]|uniref:host cell division inhibitor Icd-like protein n=1 Tax=Enterobacter TaxID=547 RepID=UPI0015B6208C|nr:MULTISPECIES: host cell division inhibitor Icd-like protein [Enterobacter]HAS0832159.1 ash family protein [Enterobacter cloacae subsp. cloacae]NWJ82987.1 host cell division inhibitor Icd-like protein [Enterobacter sp. SECR19-1250]QUG51243.1 host cell division inhibitor Icd-like protein [Enterobacter cloacae]HDS4822869.1 host cell division inhibitor Icd-like protein [Enterobacter cloacae]HDT2259486.1 host cell division inhibitor Icd-like protein [Enterobacter cloacae]
MPTVQNKAFPLAGLMCTLRGIAHAHEGKAGITAPANASSSFSRRGDEESFETSTRTKINWGSLREEDFSIITTRGGKIFLTSPLDAGNLCNSTRTREGEFLESIKKGLPTIANPVYGYRAPAESGAGIGVPITCIVPTRTKRVFLSAKFLRTQIMVGWMRLPKGRPVSIQAGYANLVQLTTSLRLASLGGEFKIHCIEAAIMATTPTQNPHFIWLIAAVRRDMPTITAKIHHIAAETERDARRTLARDHVCFFAGRIRLEVAA